MAMRTRPANPGGFGFGLVFSVAAVVALLVVDLDAPTSSGVPLGVLMAIGLAAGVVLMWVGWTKPLELTPDQRVRRRRSMILCSLAVLGVFAVLAVLQVVSSRS